MEDLARRREKQLSLALTVVIGEQSLEARRALVSALAELLRQSIRGGELEQSGGGDETITTDD